MTTTADAEVGFVLRSEVMPAARLSEVDYVKVVVGFSPIDAELVGGATDSGSVPSSTTTTIITTTTTVPAAGEG